ncbi:MAG: hypothetical protein Ta2B_16890 [Termitinemataceae bacterium]|nr:MAG: hypothetical protein Ta2B_16890 [Termitinemataceae bacterium]
MIKEFIEELRRTLKDANVLTPEVKEYLDSLLSNPEIEADDFLNTPEWNNYFKGEGGLFAGDEGSADNVGVETQYNEVIASYTNPDGTKKEGWLKAPNGKSTNLSERQWVQVRTPAFKKWFGDWEAAAKIKQFENSQIKIIDTSEIIPSTDLKEFRKNAYNYGRKIAGRYINKSDGSEFTLTTSSRLGSLKEILEHDYKDSEHLKSIAAIPYIAENAIFITAKENDDISKHPQISEFRYYLSKIKIDNIDYVVKSIISVASDGKRYYDHKLTKLGALNSLSVIQKTDWKNNPTPIKDIRLLEILQEANPSEVSKAIDANGEPLVVYHYGTFGVDDFVPNTKKGMHYGSEKAAQQRSKDKRTKKETAMTAAFLNLKNPMELPDAYIKDWSGSLKYALDKGADGIEYINKVEDKGSKSFIISNPNQAKSATDNNGDFSENLSILYELEQDELEADARQAIDQGMSKED